jgi:hypothetical protein
MQRIGRIGLALWIGCGALMGCGESGLFGPDAYDASSMSTGGGGKNLVVAAAGMQFQPTILAITVPVSTPAAIVESKLTWAGRSTSPDGDATIVVNGIERTGSLVARLEVPESPSWVFVYELDASGILNPGNNLLFVSGFSLTGRTSGIAAAAVIDDPAGPWTSVRLAQPVEFVHGNSSGFERGDVISFPITPSPDPRTARLVVVVADCLSSLADRTWWSAGSGGPGADLVGGPGLFSNRYNSAFGARIDILNEPSLPVIAGASYFAYQLESPPGGDSMVQLMSALCTTGVDPLCEGSVAGAVWRDADRDGTQNSGETGLASVRIELGDESGAFLAETWSDGAGIFSFGDLCAGSYVVTVDEATLPANHLPTTCSGGDCSPAAVVTDGESGAQVAFGYAAPSGPMCFFGPGFWMHEVDVAAGLNPGEGSMSADEVRDLLAAALAATDVDYGGGDGILDLQEASAALHQNGGADQRARRHYLVALLNCAYSGSNPALMVDTNGDGTPDMSFGQAIDAIDALLVGSPTVEECRQAMRMATSIHSMRDPLCTARA